MDEVPGIRHLAAEEMASPRRGMLKPPPPLAIPAVIGKSRNSDPSP
jgi:hypothetical protein